MIGDTSESDPLFLWLLARTRTPFSRMTVGETTTIKYGYIFPKLWREL